MAITAKPELDVDEAQSQSALGTAAARKLADTTKSAPQASGITDRWLLRMLPWVDVPGGTYRVNRRLTHPTGLGRVAFSHTGAKVELVPESLTELPWLRGFDGLDTLRALASKLTRQEVEAGTVVVKVDQPSDRLFLVASGKANKLVPGKYDAEVVSGTLAEGDAFGEKALIDADAVAPFTVKTLTPTVFLTLSRTVFEGVLKKTPELKAHLQAFQARAKPAQDSYGQAAIHLSAGHQGEAALPGTFVDYDLSPREYALSLVQTRLQVHSRVADIYNKPMDQVAEQRRLAIEALRERQESELINNRDFGLLHNVDLKQRLQTRGGPPGPDDLDELLSRRRRSHFFLAHPRAIAAFGRECNKRGLSPEGAELSGVRVRAWRGVPILPCDKIPISAAGTTSFFVMRTGQEKQGVIGLYQTGLPDEVEPGLSVRLMGINEKAILSYLISGYFSAAVLIPDALGVLDDVEINQ